MQADRGTQGQTVSYTVTACPSGLEEGSPLAQKYQLPVSYLRIIVLMSPEGDRRGAGTTGLTTQAQEHARSRDVPTGNNTDGCRTHCVVSAQTPQAPSPTCGMGLSLETVGMAFRVVGTLSSPDDGP